MERRLAEECEKYDARVAEYVASSRPHPPLRKGTLIFDVAAKLHWNSRDNQLVGHTTTPEEMSSLKDLYEVLESDPEAENADYVMQALWRDLSSNCDIVGLYYISSGPFKAKSMLACVLEALRKFHAHGFNVCLLICDGASSNLTILLGRKGQRHDTL